MTIQPGSAGLTDVRYFTADYSAIGAESVSAITFIARDDIPSDTINVIDATPGTTLTWRARNSLVVTNVKSPQLSNAPMLGGQPQQVNGREPGSGGARRQDNGE